MVELRLPKPTTGVRFPSLAPKTKTPGIFLGVFLVVKEGVDHKIGLQIMIN